MFEYLVDKISNARFEIEPFKHIYIEEFFTEHHFREIIIADEVAIGRADNDRQLIEKLYAAGYEEIDFPGTTTDIDAYIEWHSKKKVAVPWNGAMTNKDLCEGVGIALRLQEARSDVIRTLTTFLKSDAWLDAIALKFDIDRATVRSDGGIQKYLDGYEISPHPDIRLKALTYMVNINPSQEAAEILYNTQYMRFRREKAYVQEFWKGNQDLDRCWVPWSWCETIKTQNKNNTIVLFQPADDTLHAVSANYDHLNTQRTQLYGNLWYQESRTTGKPTWADLDVRSMLTSA